MTLLFLVQNLVAALAPPATQASVSSWCRLDLLLFSSSTSFRLNLLWWRLDLLPARESLPPMSGRRYLLPVELLPARLAVNIVRFFYQAEERGDITDFR